MKHFPRTVLTVAALTQIPTLTYMELISFPAANHLVPLPKNTRTHRLPQFLPTSAKPNVITRAEDCSPTFLQLRRHFAPAQAANFRRRRAQSLQNTDGSRRGQNPLEVFEVRRCRRLHEQHRAGRWLQSGENQSGDYTGPLFARSTHTKSSEDSGNNLPQKFEAVADID